MTYTWEPAYGFCGVITTDRVKLAKALEAVRRRVCSYGSHGARGCDCKYGLTTTMPHDPQLTEQTGCPELRELINRLLHRPNTLVPSDMDALDELLEEGRT